MSPKLLENLTAAYKLTVNSEDFLAYLAAVVAHPAYTARFRKDLAQPGLRISLTAQAELFTKAVDLGRRVIWLYTFGERFVDAKADCPPEPPRLKERAPRMPRDGAIPLMPIQCPTRSSTMKPWATCWLAKVISPTCLAVWNYEVSGKRVLTQWFSYRKKIESGRSSATAGRPRSWEIFNPNTGWPNIRPNCSTCCTFWRCSWKWNQTKRNFWRRSVKEKTLSYAG